MANHNSAIVAGLEGDPGSVANVNVLGGKKRVLVSSVEIEASDNNGDTFTLFPVSLTDRVDDVKVFNDSILSGSNYDLGFYKITAGTLGAVIDSDKLADNLNLGTGRSVYTSVLGIGGSSVDLGTEANEPVWKMCGYSSLPEAIKDNETNQVYVVLTAIAAGTGAGSVTVKMDLVVD